jgi:hypothetical protein
MRKVIDESRSIHSGAVSVSIRAESLELELDPRELAAGPARAMRTAVQEGLTAAGASSPRLKHGADWLASDVQLRESDRGVFEVSLPGGGRSPSGPLVKALERSTPALKEPFTPAGVQRALKLADDLIARVRRR